DMPQIILDPKATVSLAFVAEAQ
ncbi:MAG: hypothetical protein QOH93_1705, partial [Chloroflexia bacterium]|nr:hypothetical protein [Chloroflexia bacterium]